MSYDAIHSGEISESESTSIQRASESPRAPVLASNPGAHSMQDLLHFAIERGTPVEQLEKLVDLADRMDRRQGARDFAEAMAAFQAECPAVHKGKTANIPTKSGTKYSYTYADLDEIVAVVRPLLTKNGLSFRFNTKHDGKLLTIDCVVSHTNGHSETSTFTLPIDNPSAMSDQQKVGAASTYGKRQALSAALGITTTDQDVDGAAVAAADPRKVDDDQITALEDLIGEVGADKARFLAYMGAEKLADLRAAEYTRAVSTLRQLSKKKKERAP